MRHWSCKFLFLAICTKIKICGHILLLEGGDILYYCMQLKVLLYAIEVIMLPYICFFFFFGNFTFAKVER